jgi:hypothetical protein
MSTSRVYTVGQVLTAAQVNDLSQGVLNFTTSSADIGPTSGTTELDVITAGAVTVAASTRRIKVTFSCQSYTGMTNGDVFLLRIKEGATVLQVFTVVASSAAVTYPGGTYSTLINPTAASHTYKVTIQRSAGTGVVTIVGAGPLQLIVEDCGAV